MPYHVYILKSDSTGRYYCGSTGNLARRVSQHNDRNYTGSKTTKRFTGPWNLAWAEKHTTRSDAVVRERHIKKRGINRFLKSVESRHGRD